MPRSPIIGSGIGCTCLRALLPSLCLLSVACGGDGPTDPDTNGPPLEIVGDANTVILDHFNRTTTGTPAGSLMYGASVGSLAEAADLGKGTYVKYALPASLESEGTVEFWLRPRVNGSTLLNFNWGNTTFYPSAGHVLHVGLDANGRVAIGGWASNSACMYPLTSARSLSLNQWHHIAISWGTQTKIYIDGAVSASSPQCFRPASPAWGYLNYWGDQDAGLVDELHISKVQRSDAEISMHAEK